MKQGGEPDREQGGEPGRGPGREPGSERGGEPDREQGGQPGRGPGWEPGTEQGQGQGQGQGLEKGQEPRTDDQTAGTAIGNRGRASSRRIRQSETEDRLANQRSRPSGLGQLAGERCAQQQGQGQEPRTGDRTAGTAIRKRGRASILAREAIRTGTIGDRTACVASKSRTTGEQTACSAIKTRITGGFTDRQLAVLPW